MQSWAAIGQWRSSIFLPLAYVGESVTDPEKYYCNNVCGSLTLLKAILDHGVKTIVFSSTCATYGVPHAIPIREETAQHPINPYGASKLMVERIFQDFDATYDIKSIALHCFNAAGADPDNEIGEDHDPETHLIPLVLDAASGRRPNVTIFGSDYESPDGTCIHDYIHVSDLAKAQVLAPDELPGGRSSGAYNLGNGRGFSVREVIDTVERVTGLEVPVVMDQRRAGDPASLNSNATKVRDELGWQPTISNLTDIVRSAWTWHQRQGPVSKGAARPCVSAVTGDPSS